MTKAEILARDKHISSTDNHWHRRRLCQYDKKSVHNGGAILRIQFIAKPHHRRNPSVRETERR